MKSIISLLSILLSFSATAAVYPDFYCETTKRAEKIEVRYVEGTLTYDDGRSTEVAIASRSNNSKIFKVSGLSKGLIFAGGGRQSVSVTLDLETKKGTLIIYTKTFYRQTDISEELICTL